jgi:hypothetical protein
MGALAADVDLDDGVAPVVVDEAFADDVLRVEGEGRLSHRFFASGLARRKKAPYRSAFRV